MTPPEYSNAFLFAWNAYPKRPNHSKMGAWKAWNARLKEGATTEEMITGVQSYAKWCEAEKVNPRYIKMAQTFFGPDRHFENNFTPSVSAEDANFYASLKAELEFSNVRGA